MVGSMGGNARVDNFHIPGIFFVTSHAVTGRIIIIVVDVVVNRCATIIDGSDPKCFILHTVDGKRKKRLDGLPPTVGKEKEKRGA